MKIKPGFCVKLPDGRIGRARNKNLSGLWKIRVRRFTSNTHQFLYYKSKELTVIPCPSGWMSVDGYNRYLRKTLAKMRSRNKRKSRRKSRRKSKRRLKRKSKRRLK